ncbi:hypothetical protein DFH07DRAFT_1058717 [Mycena maculata]|uniref:Hydrophobin n=1 Tax=Mycena maculata TaxID=230809 RepID=A0AAD7JMF6_9AGAR|nr:hypothetical protein DFH07DRAFT_1058717 [Mycena maculata]
MNRAFLVLLFLFGVNFSTTAAARETNGQRMARGLPPFPPRWMPTRPRVYGADNTSRPSPSPSSPILPCRAGGVPLCCDSAVPAADTTAALLLKLLDAPTPDTDSALVGITCSPFHIAACARQAVCCDRDEFDGVIATGCVLRRP